MNNPYRKEIQPESLVIGNKYDLEIGKCGGKKKRNNKKKRTRRRKGGGIGKSKPIKPPTPPKKTRKSVSFSPTTKSPSSPIQNKTKKMFISRNKKRQKAVTRYQQIQSELDLMDMILGKIPLN